jgi:hypothetical protein
MGPGRARTQADRQQFLPHSPRRRNTPRAAQPAAERAPAGRRTSRASSRSCFGKGAALRGSRLSLLPRLHLRRPVRAALRECLARENPRLRIPGAANPNRRLRQSGRPATLRECSVGEEHPRREAPRSRVAGAERIHSSAGQAGATHSPRGRAATRSRAGLIRSVSSRPSRQSSRVGRLRNYLAADPGKNSPARRVGTPVRKPKARPRSRANRQRRRPRLPRHRRALATTRA